MYKYKITIILKNGSMLRGIHNTALTDLAEIVEELIPDVNTGHFSVLAPEDSEKKENWLFVTSEVAAFKIEVPE